MIKRLAIIGYGAIAKDILHTLSPLLEEQVVEVLILKRSALSDIDADALPSFAKATQDRKSVV